MTNRELLELAAKAAGISLKYADIENGDWWIDEQGTLWNPFTDDGDALRLAVKLDIQIAKNSCNTAAIAFKAPGLQINEWFDQHPDQYTATRRAIVRAAAEIGKGM